MTHKKSEVSEVDTQNEYWQYAQLFEYLLNKDVSISNNKKFKQKHYEENKRNDNKTQPSKCRI